MRQIDHPNIIKLIDFAESRQYYYIILELAPGGELFHQIVRLTYFSEDLSRHVITQVAKALEYLHEERGVVHRYALSIRQLARPSANDPPVISSRRTSSSTRYPSSPPNTPSRSNLGTKTRQTKVNSSRESGPVGSGRSRLRISASPRSCGTIKP